MADGSIGNLSYLTDCPNLTFLSISMELLPNSSIIELQEPLCGILKLTLGLQQVHGNSTDLIKTYFRLFPNVEQFKLSVCNDAGRAAMASQTELWMFDADEYLNALIPADQGRGAEGVMWPNLFHLILRNVRVNFRLLLDFTGKRFKRASQDQPPADFPGMKFTLHACWKLPHVHAMDHSQLFDAISEYSYLFD